MKKNKKEFIISSVMILLPILIGLLFWNRLPEQVPTSWGFDGKVNGSSSRITAVFVVPIVIFVAHCLSVFVTEKDKKNKRQNEKISHLMLWICPVISILTSGLMYSFALGMEFNVNLIMCPFLGFLFLLIGNYLPKCRQNQTIGIRVKWTLEDEDNWNATHRLSGKLWVFGGMWLIVLTFFPRVSIFCSVIVLTMLTLIPIVFSYSYAKTKKKG